MKFGLKKKIYKSFVRAFFKYKKVHWILSLIACKSKSRASKRPFEKIHFKLKKCYKMKFTVYQQNVQEESD